jgi:hypothetical protein
MRFMLYRRTKAWYIDAVADVWFGHHSAAQRDGELGQASQPLKHGAVAAQEAFCPVYIDSGTGIVRPDL